MSAVTVSSKGQIVLPKEARQALGIEQGDRLEVKTRGKELVLRLLPQEPQPRAKGWRAWRGVLRGTKALEEHVAEHRDEVRRERLP